MSRLSTIYHNPIMLDALGKNKIMREYIRELVISESKRQGGDDYDVIAVYLQDLYTEYADNLEKVIDCFESILPPK